MKVIYDRVSNVAYIYLVDKIGKGQVHKTYCCDPLEVGGQIHLDFDQSGQLLGVEVLDARSKLPKTLLESAEDIT